ncbi:anillin isoform X1 [Erpetoichthys calabaricus]|uniref:anillin isoform X1 n=1 Tax=Erpetoichthys calabaricus TaxID=27687 RepID=UPI0022341CDA|nr:anillin isoform X1 [Erpetoichthys calabaricus]
MDPFTEKLLERTRARRENLQKKMSERPAAAVRPMAKRLREPLSETNNQSEQTPVEVKSSNKPSPSKRRCSDNKETGEVAEENRKPLIESASTYVSKPPIPTTPAASCVVKSDCAEVKSDTLSNKVHLTTSVKSRLQKLAEQRQCWDNNEIPAENAWTSPVHPPKPTSPPKKSEFSSHAVGRKGRLACLAETINTWEDDLSQPAIKKNNAQEQPGTTCLSKPSTTNVASACAQNGNVKSNCASYSETAVETSVNKPVSSVQQHSNIYPPIHSTRSVPLSLQNASISVPSPVQQSSSSQNTEVLNALSKQTAHGVITKDDSELKRGVTLKGTDPELFESTKPVYSLPKKEPHTKETHVQQTKEISTPGGPGVKSFLERFGERCQERSTQSPLSTIRQKTPTVTPNTKIIQEKLFKPQQSATASLTQQKRLEREKELASIRSRIQKGNMWTVDKDDCSLKQPQDNKKETPQEAQVDESLKPPANSSSETSLKEERSPSDVLLTNETNLECTPIQASPVKQITPLRKKAGELCVDTENVVSKTEDDVNSSAIIKDIFNDVHERSEQDESKTSVEIHGQGEEEEEDMNDNELNISSMSLTPLVETVASVVTSPEVASPRKTAGESSETPERKTKGTRYQRARVPRAASVDSLDSVAEEKSLLYSIDAYRSQRFKEVDQPQVKQVIVRNEDVSQRLEVKSTAQVNIKQKIKMLNNEVNVQQTVIHQASQALNCCFDEEHGKGSQEEAEAERLLLISTEKRTALLAEINKLKNEEQTGAKVLGSAKEQSCYSASKGTISLSELRLPLKADFICSTANKTDGASYSFFIMIRAGAENIVATPLANPQNALSGDALTFTTKFSLSEVSNDFEIDLELYSLVQRREVPFEKRKKSSKSKHLWRMAKFHLSHAMCFLAITPKRLLTSITKSNLHTPVMASPGGPNAVRTSNFTLVGSHRLTLESIGKNKLTLDKVPFLSPIEGHVYLKLQCQVGSSIEERGFLTMFEDVSGFGAWHRRWCLLSGYCISYWTYPDDEKRKSPIGRINLANCTSKKIEPANWEYCARPNTFELITVRPQREDDKETLVSQCRNTLCVTKNWLSADTKEERNMWMQKLNQVVMDLRMWQPDACYRPV